MTLKEEDKHLSIKEETEFRDTFAKIDFDLRATSTILINLFFIMLFSRYVLRNNVPLGLIFLSLAWFSFYLFIWRPILRKRKTTDAIHNFYFFYTTIDIFILTGVVHYTGGADWLGPLFYALTITSAGLILPRKKAFFITLFILLSYASLIILEAVKIIPHQPMFILSPNLYRSFGFVATQILISAALFYFLVDTAGKHYELLKQKIVQLKKERKRVVLAYHKAKEAEKILEVRVKARTEELEGVSKKQEEIIQERTKELEEKVADLEKFQRLVVGRELKMIELKGELDKTKGRVSNGKGSLAPQGKRIKQKTAVLIKEKI